MRTWFTGKVKYFKTIEGADKPAKVTEAYMVQAETFTEAETGIYKKCEEFIRGEFQVDGLSKANFDEVVPSHDAEDWYKVKINYLLADEKSGKEKKVAAYSLIQALDVRDAYEKVEELLKGSMHSYVIPSIGITNVLEVWPYESIFGESEEFGDIAGHTVDMQDNLKAAQEAAAILSTTDSSETEGNTEEEKIPETEDDTEMVNQTVSVEVEEEAAENAEISAEKNTSAEE